MIQETKEWNPQLITRPRKMLSFSILPFLCLALFPFLCFAVHCFALPCFAFPCFALPLLCPALLCPALFCHFLFLCNGRRENGVLARFSRVQGLFISKSIRRVVPANPSWLRYLHRCPPRPRHCPLLHLSSCYRHPHPGQVQHSNEQIPRPPIVPSLSWPVLAP